MTTRFLKSTTAIVLALSVAVPGPLLAQAASGSAVAEEAQQLKDKAADKVDELRKSLEQATGETAKDEGEVKAEGEADTAAAEGAIDAEGSAEAETLPAEPAPDAVADAPAEKVPGPAAEAAPGQMKTEADSAAAEAPAADPAATAEPQSAEAPAADPAPTENTQAAEAPAEGAQPETVAGDAPAQTAPEQAPAASAEAGADAPAETATAAPEQPAADPNAQAEAPAADPNAQENAQAEAPAADPNAQENAQAEAPAADPNAQENAQAEAPATDPNAQVEAPAAAETPPAQPEATAEAAPAMTPEQQAQAQAEAEAARAQQEAQSMAASAAAGQGEVQTQTVTEDTARSSTEEFANQADANVQPQQQAEDKDGLSDAQKLGLLGIGGVALAAILDNMNGNVVSNSGDRIVVEENGQYRVLKDDDVLIRRPGTEVQTYSFQDGSTRTVAVREDGTQVETIRAADGRVLSRTRILPDGQQVVLFDDTRQAQAVDVNQLPQVTQTRPVETQNADAEALRAALRAEADRDYGRTFSLSQVRNINAVRRLVPEIEVDTINFETGSSTIRPEEAEELAALGSAMREAIEANPREVFLVEGHTDAVGAAGYNLALSDRRAETVALALTEYFDVPPENMIVQGYGESDLKVQTATAERENRRAAVRRITPLLGSQG